jgi:hypothetical protein
MGKGVPLVLLHKAWIVLLQRSLIVLSIGEIIPLIVLLKALTVLLVVQRRTSVVLLKIWPWCWKSIAWFLDIVSRRKLKGERSFAFGELRIHRSVGS